MDELTRENVARTIPGAESIPATTDLSDFPRRWMDLAYSTGSEAQKLNITLPNIGEGPFPVVVYFHGGGWLIGDKNHVQTQSVHRLLYAGYAVVSVNYRLSDEAKWPANLYDCKAAIRFLRANGNKYQLDTERIGVVGNSAGGHMAALLGTTNGLPEFEDISMGWADYSSSIQAAFIWFGIYDFVNWKQDFEKAYGKPLPNIGAEAYMFGHSIQQVSQDMIDASPIVHLSPSTTVPFYVEHGTGDHAVPWYQCQRFYDRYAELLGKDNIQIHLFEGAEHSAACYKEDKNVFEFVKFFDQYIRKIEPREYFELGRLGEIPTKTE